MRDQILTVQEAANMVKCSTRTILRWIETGSLPAARLPGGEYRIRVADIDELLEPSTKSTGEGEG